MNSSPAQVPESIGYTCRSILLSYQVVKWWTSMTNWNCVTNPPEVRPFFENFSQYLRYRFVSLSVDDCWILHVCPRSINAIQCPVLRPSTIFSFRRGSASRLAMTFYSILIIFILFGGESTQSVMTSMEISLSPTRLLVLSTLVPYDWQSKQHRHRWSTLAAWLELLILRNWTMLAQLRSKKSL